MRSKFLEIENNIEKRLHTTFSIFNNEEETDASTQFLWIQKLIDLMQHLER